MNLFIHLFILRMRMPWRNGMETCHSHPVPFLQHNSGLSCCLVLPNGANLEILLLQDLPGPRQKGSAPSQRSGPIVPVHLLSPCIPERLCFLVAIDVKLWSAHDVSTCLHGEFVAKEHKRNVVRGWRVANGNKCLAAPCGRKEKWATPLNSGATSRVSFWLDFVRIEVRVQCTVCVAGLAAALPLLLPLPCILGVKPYVGNCRSAFEPNLFSVKQTNKTGSSMLHFLSPQSTPQKESYIKRNVELELVTKYLAQ